MERQLSSEIVDSIAKIVLIQNRTCIKCAKIIGKAIPIPGGTFSFFPSGVGSLNILINLDSKQYVLKLDETELFLRSMKRQKWLQEKKEGIVPHIQSDGIGELANGKKYYYMVQEFLPGKLLGDISTPILDEQLGNLAHDMKNIHQIRPGDDEKGFGKLKEDNCGKYKNFDEYIGSFVSILNNSPHFSDVEKNKLAGLIEFKKAQCAGIAHNRYLIHGDFHPENIIIPEDNQKPHIIDFGSLEWSFPEKDFATLLTYEWSQNNISSIETLKTFYQKDTKLNTDMLDLMCLCMFILKLAKRMRKGKVYSENLECYAPYIYFKSLVSRIEKEKSGI